MGMVDNYIVKTGFDQLLDGVFDQWFACGLKQRLGCVIC
jgi:hypothetical protein